MEHRPESRNAERYNFFSRKLNEFDIRDIYFVIEPDEKVKGTIADISLNGLGALISGLDEDRCRSIAARPGFFLKLHFGKEVILAGVKIVWNNIAAAEGETVLKAGLKFDIMSGEDKLKLTDVIETMRNSIAQ